MTAAGEPMRVPPLRWPSDAELWMPSSKSEANRLLVAAALRGREGTVMHVTPSDDVLHLIDGLRTLGFAVAFDTASAKAVLGPRTPDAAARGELFCGNAGTALRFLVSVAAITPGEWTLTGDAAMQRRPIAPLVAAWRQLGIEIEDTGGCPPVRVRGRGDVRGGSVQLDASVSSQFVSSLLLVGAALPDGLDVRFTRDLASAAYVDLTCELLRGFGVVVTVHDAGVRVAPGYGNLRGLTQVVHGDWSSMGVWTCLDHLTGSRVNGDNLGYPSAQPDERLRELLRAIPSHGEARIDVRHVPDQFMNVAVVAAHRAGTTRLVGGTNLRVKESDRIAVMARELTKLGVDVDELPDGLVIRGGRPLRAATIDPANDHRIAMAFALAGLLSPGIAIADPGCVAKSYPRFWDDLARVVRDRRCVAVVGMRAAGKSTFARALASATDSLCVDTDELLASTLGPIDAHVAANGWSTFREMEEGIMFSVLRPRSVVATGGGAIENERTRAAFRRSALVVWLDADIELLRARLAADAAARPSVTGRPVLDEIDELLARRRPLYEQVAHVRIDAALPTSDQVEIALRALGAPCRWPGSDASGATT